MANSKNTPPNTDRASLRDVAASVGISPALALRCLRQEDDITPAFAKRVIDAAAQLGFQSTNLQADTAGGVVAVLVNSMRNPWISDIVRAIRIELSATGRSAVVMPTRRRVPEVPVAADLEAVRAVKALGVEGFILLGSLPGVDSIIETLGNTPVIAAGTAASEVGRLDTVRIDDEVGQGLLVDHLVSLGHKDIAHVGGLGGTVGRERADAFLSAMKRHGLAEHARVEPGDATEQVGRTAGTMLLRGASVPTAITCNTDISALGVLTAAKEYGFAVPHDLAVAGYGNTTIAESGPVSLTSVAPDNNRIGALAAQYVVDRIGRLDVEFRDVRVAPQLVVRNSTSAAPSSRTRRQRISVD